MKTYQERYQRVLDMCFRVPTGRVFTAQEIAEQTGEPQMDYLLLNHLSENQNKVHEGRTLRKVGQDGWKWE